MHVLSLQPLKSSALLHKQMTRMQYQDHACSFQLLTCSRFMQTAFGDHSLASALRLLLASALEDPLNQRFQLLCPATIPIRPPLFTYTQLMAEPRSRVGWFAPVRGRASCCGLHEYMHDIRISSSFPQGAALSYDLAKSGHVIMIIAGASCIVATDCPAAPGEQHGCIYSADVSHT